MKADFFQNNRARLMEKLGGGLVVASAYTGMQRQNDMAHAFSQEANFWYLTGIEQPDWRVIIDGTTHQSWLVLPDIDDQHKLFDGSLDPAEAKKQSGVTGVLSHDEAQSKIRQLAKKHSIAYTTQQPSYASHFNFHLNPALGNLSQELERIFSSVVGCNKELAQLRAIKQPEEIKLIETAVKLTSRAFTEVKNKFSSYSYEYEIEADMTHYFRTHGAAGHAYDPIIASGKNACTLHYTDNSAKLQRNAAVLLDVGARIDGYAADISRTYTKGEPTKRIRELHETLQQAHFEIVALLGPNVAVEDYMKNVDGIMAKALQSVGLIKPGDTDALRTYFPHSVSHGLGIDVHDALGQPRYFEPGMVLTVEPGIYIPEEGIGLRIEDNILITQSGNRNLSKGLSTAL